MPIQYVGGVTGTAPSGGSVTLSLTALTGGIDTAARTDDLVIVSISHAGLTDATPGVSSPTGFTEVTELYANDSYDANLSVNYKIMGATPDTSVVTLSSATTTNSTAVTIHVFRGVGVNPLDVTAVTTTGTNSILANPGAITPVTSGAWVYVVGAGSTPSGAAFSASYLTAPLSAVGSDIYDAVILSGYVPNVTGTYDPGAFTFAAADNTTYSWAAVTLALRPRIAGPASGSIEISGSATGSVQNFSGPISAVSSGVLDFSGSAQGILPIKASSSGSLDVAGSSTGVVSQRGQASGSISLDGSSTARNLVRGTSSGALDVTGSAVAKNPINAQSPAKGLIEYVGGTTGSASNGANVTLSLQSTLTGGSRTSVQPGDLVIVSVSVASTIDASIGVISPTDFVEITELYTNNTYDSNLSVSYKVMGSTPDTSITLQNTGALADSIAVTVQVFSGVDLDIFDVTTLTSTGTGNVLAQPPSITPVSRDAWVVVIAGGANSTSAVYTTTTLSGFLSSFAADTSDVTIGAGYVPNVQSTYSPATFTGGGGAQTGSSWTAVTLALKPKYEASFPITGSATVQSSMSGEASGTFTVSPTITGQVLNLGQVSGQATFEGGTSTARALIQATSSGSAPELTGSAAAIAIVRATASSSFDVSGTAQGTNPISGSVSGTFQIPSTGSAAIAIVGQVSGSFDLLGSASSRNIVTSFAIGSFDLSGTAQGVVPIKAEASGEIPLEPLSIPASIAVASGVFNPLLTASAKLDVSGSAEGALTVDSAATAKVVVRATATGVVSVEGTASAIGVTPVVASGSLDIGGQSQAKTLVSASAAGVLNATGSSTGSVAEIGEAAGVLSVVGSATASVLTKGSTAGVIEVSGQASSKVQVRGAAVTEVGLVGSGTIVSTTRGQAQGQIDFEGHALVAGNNAIFDPTLPRAQAGDSVNNADVIAKINSTSQIEKKNAAGVVAKLNSAKHLAHNRNSAILSNN